jgi:hypothetical protein
MAIVAAITTTFGLITAITRGPIMATAMGMGIVAMVVAMVVDMVVDMAAMAGMAATTIARTITIMATTTEVGASRSIEAAACRGRARPLH